MALKNKRFKPDRWNNNKYIRYSHNCYEYALNKISKKDAIECKKTEKKKNKSCNYLKHQPGFASGWSRIKNKKYTCKKLEKRIKGDNPDLYKTKRKKCKKGFYKIGLVVNPNKRYHFYRQHDNGMWSHKEGQTKATNKDASNKKITNLSDADMVYNDRKYTKVCGEYCIPIDKYRNSSHNEPTKDKNKSRKKPKLKNTTTVKRKHIKRHNL